VQGRDCPAQEEQGYGSDRGFEHPPMKVGADHIRQIVLSLRNFSRLDESEVKPVDQEGIDSTLTILH